MRPSGKENEAWDPSYADMTKVIDNANSLCVNIHEPDDLLMRGASKNNSVVKTFW